ncbi:PC-esterase domain-containing protein 1A-like [Elgaria multicarinata webbii]|uniref:PC-esterase domain-containing protein 1A-like n=1 Tax=Elgaria multicarinata webbii TaxID=159646 RepID=UPI002FCCC910
MLNFRSKEVRQLPHNKFVVILGDSIQRSVYKDLIRLLQNDSLLTSSQMKAKGDLRFENDRLIEGGVLGGLHNGTHYREVRQYRTSHHLVRFYFLTRVYWPYLESILDDFRTGLQPDVLILNSCVWDILRSVATTVKENALHKTPGAFRISSECLTTVASRVIGTGSMCVSPPSPNTLRLPAQGFLRNDVIEGNFHGATLAGFHLFDVMDLHYHFRLDLRNRAKDGVHWNNVVHRRITSLLLAHVAGAWGVALPDPKRWEGPVWENRLTVPFGLLGVLLRPLLADLPEGFLDQRGARRPDPPGFHEDSFLFLSDWESAEPFSGFSSFEDSHVPPPFHLDGPGRENRPAVPLDLSRPPLADPPEGFPDRRGTRGPDPPVSHEGSFLILSDWESAEPFSGFTSFEDSRVPPPFRLDGIPEPTWRPRTGSPRVPRRLLPRPQRLGVSGALLWILQLQGLPRPTSLPPGRYVQRPPLPRLPSVPRGSSFPFLRAAWTLGAMPGLPTFSLPCSAVDPGFLPSKVAKSGPYRMKSSRGLLPGFVTDKQDGMGVL